MEPNYRNTNGRRTAAVVVQDDMSSSNLWRRRAGREPRGLVRVRSEPIHHESRGFPQEVRQENYLQRYPCNPPMNVYRGAPNGVPYQQVCLHCHRNEEFCVCRQRYFYAYDEFDDYSSGIDSGLGEPMTPSTDSSSYESLTSDTSDEDQEALRVGFQQLSRCVPDLSSPDKHNPYSILCGAIRQINNMSKMLGDRQYDSPLPSEQEFNYSDSDSFRS